MSKHVVAPVRELPPGSRKLVQVDGRPIVIFNIGGEFFALLNRCPHQGGNLCEGKLIGLVESGEPGVYRWRETTQGNLTLIELDALQPKPITLHRLLLHRTS